MKKNILILAAIIITILILTYILSPRVQYNLRLEQLKQEYAKTETKSVEHSKFKILNQEFNTPQEVTEACLVCHNKRHEEIIASSHWNWERVAYIDGRGLHAIGKKNVLNNFCIGSKTNEQACAKCHIGFGMTNDKFDFKNARNVDCMVCHDNSEEYLKGSAMAGYPARNINLTKVAQSVGSPRKSNCGSCHFYSGGGNNVKHGDLEEAQLACTREVDVHMASNGMNMTCVDCHETENHQMLGKLYSVSASNINRATCEQCHTEKPHFDNVVNRHSAKVACQTCHIPTYAKVNSTKMSWKWSEAGKKKDGKSITEKDSLGNVAYMSKKGSFTWSKDIEPDYMWFNGTADHYLLGDKVDSFPVYMNKLYGSADDPNSKIIPVKVHIGDQLYDNKTKLLVQPKLFAKHKGDSAYWKDFDWKLAAEAGMKKIGLPYSGDYKFVETKMYWPVNHMVAPKGKTVSCSECHTRENGRMASIQGIYIPGRDNFSILDFLGSLIVLGSLAGVLVHAAIRIFVTFRKGEYVSETINQ